MPVPHRSNDPSGGDWPRFSSMEATQMRVPGHLDDIPQECEGLSSRFSIPKKQLGPPGGRPTGPELCLSRGASIHGNGHGLELGVIVERLLAELSADAAVLEPAEGRGG